MEAYMEKKLYIENMNKWEKSFSFSQRINVRFSETDMFGHLNNTVPFIYFESVRLEYLKYLGFIQCWVKPESEHIPVVADLQCDFLQQVYFDEELMVYIKADSIGRSSVDLHYMGKNQNGEICFTGRGTMVQISKKTGKGAPWSKEMRQKLSSNSGL
jgi:acyl-CoA thioester hydrolase